MAKANSKIRTYERKDDQLELALTAIEYSGLERAKRFFNVELFDGSLPDIFITYQRKANSVGSFASDEFAGRIGDFNRDGIRLNPDTFVGQTDAQILQNLVYLMTQGWQKYHGKPSARGYVNRELADKLKSIGLQPTSSGGVGGRETGPRISVYAVPDGPFERACDKLLADGWRLNLQTAPREGPKDRAAKNSSKTKFTCPKCRLNIWGKPEALVDCHACRVLMLPEAKEASQSYEQKPAEPVNGVAHLGDDRTIEGTTQAEKIRRLREDNHLTLKEFGERVGVSHVAVSHWESGKNSPKPRRLRQIAEIFAVPVEALWVHP